MPIILITFLFLVVGVIGVIIGWFTRPRQIYYAGDIEDLLIKEGTEIKTAKKLATAITEWLNGVGTQWG